MFFLTRNIASPPAKYPGEELFKSTQGLIYFLIPPIQNLRLKVVPSHQNCGVGLEKLIGKKKNVTTANMYILRKSAKN